MIRLLMLFGLLASPAHAETALVYSGEHEDFTRLVIELPNAGDWTVGRTPMGYAFAAVGEPQPQFDISQVFRRIPKTRLQALQHDADTGALRLTLACACHVFPFEYAPGVIVLDIKPGPAPPASSFEAAFVMPPPDGLPAMSDTPSLSYDWLDGDPALVAMLPPETDLTLPTGTISLAPLREELLLEISRGAARGVVDMALSEEPPTSVRAKDETLPWSQIHIGPAPDSSVTVVANGEEGQSPQNEACPPDELMSVGEWGHGRRPLDLLTEARSGLYGEFDALDPEAVLRAIRLHLYLGFGAEAAQFTQLLENPALAEEVALLRSMALVIEGTPDSGSPFAEMLACDGVAALWAALALDHFPPDAVINSDAVARSFLALPPHLRAALGGTLSERLLTLGEGEAARIVRDAVGRNPEIADGVVDLLDARADLHMGEPDEALTHAEAALAVDGREVGAWIALVEAHFQKGEPLPAEKAEALLAFAGEVEGLEIEGEFFRALSLAQILSGQPAAGFSIAAERDVPRSDLWLTTVAIATDDDFLRQAVSGTIDPVAPEVANAVAARLIKLGFPDAAALWLTPTGPDDPPERRRIAAEAELSRGDARQSLTLLAGLDAPEDEALRAGALLQLGQISKAREAFVAAGLPDMSQRLAAWENAWVELEALDAPLWAPLLNGANAAKPETAGPLARGSAAIEASLASRESIEALLAGIAVPEP